MNPGNHLLLNRSLLNVRNIEKNEQCLKDMEKRLKRKLYISDLGRLVTYKRSNVARTETKPSTENFTPPCGLNQDQSTRGRYFIKIL